MKLFELVNLCPLLVPSLVNIPTFNCSWPLTKLVTRWQLTSYWEMFLWYFFLPSIPYIIHSLHVWSCSLFKEPNCLPKVGTKKKKKNPKSVDQSATLSLALDNDDCPRELVMPWGSSASSFLMFDSCKSKQWWLGKRRWVWGGIIELQPWMRANRCSPPGRRHVSHSILCPFDAV